jgi:hypothetical protein
VKNEERKMKSLIKMKASIILIIILCFGCKEENQKITPQLRAEIDSITQKRLSKILPVLDKECRDNYESSIKTLSDSLVQVRMLQIQDKINNIQQQQ